MAETQPESLAEETVFDVLSSQRRRYTLYYLRGVDVADVNEVARQVAAWENGVAIGDVERQQRKRVYVSLYQTHVPKLAATGVIEYDADAGTVTLGERAAAVDVHLAGGRESDRAWRRYYLALAVAGALFVGAVAAGVLDVSGLVVAVATVGALAAIAIAHVATDRWKAPTTPPDVRESRPR